MGIEVGTWGAANVIQPKRQGDRAMEQKNRTRVRRKRIEKWKTNVRESRGDAAAAAAAAAPALDRPSPPSQRAVTAPDKAKGAATREGRRHSEKKGGGS